MKAQVAAEGRADEVNFRENTEEVSRLSRSKERRGRGAGEASRRLSSEHAQASPDERNKIIRNTFMRILMPFDFGSSRAGAWMALIMFAVPAGGLAATAHDAFLAENRDAMEKMMVGMNTKPTGDVDRDFSAMMIAHHQGAIDMAVSELRYGRSEQLRRIAQGIVIEQRQEIEAMHAAVGSTQPATQAEGH